MRVSWMDDKTDACSKEGKTLPALRIVGEIGMICPHLLNCPWRKHSMYYRDVDSCFLQHGSRCSMSRICWIHTRQSKAAFWPLLHTLLSMLEPTQTGRLTQESRLKLPPFESTFSSASTIWCWRLFIYSENRSLIGCSEDISMSVLTAMTWKRMGMRTRLYQMRSQIFEHKLTKIGNKDKLLNWILWIGISSI